MLLLLLVFETFKLGNNWLTKLPGTVLQVEAKSICALTIFDFRREQGVNERRTSLHTQLLLCILLQTPPHLHHHQPNLTVECYLLAFLFLLYLHERNDQRFHTFCISYQTQGNDVDEDWDGCRDTKIAVALVEQKFDSHVWICS